MSYIHKTDDPDARAWDGDKAVPRCKSKSKLKPLVTNYDLRWEKVNCPRCLATPPLRPAFPPKG